MDMYHYLVKRYRDGRIWYEGYSCQADALLHMRRSNASAVQGEPLLEYVGTSLPDDVVAYEQEQTAKYLEEEFALPPLEGTDKQVKWARTIRARWASYCQEKYRGKAAEYMSRTGSPLAEWWIKNRHAMAGTNLQSRRIEGRR